MNSLHLTDDCQTERSVPRYERGPDTHEASAICKEAARLVDGDRALDYGDKIRNHANIASLWNAYLGERVVGGITAFDVAILMVLLKIARTKLGQLRLDTFVDIAGYAGIAGEIAHRGK